MKLTGLLEKRLTVRPIANEIDWATGKAIDSAANSHIRKVKEALHIAQKGPRMVKDSGLSLSASWYAAVVR